MMRAMIGAMLAAALCGSTYQDPKQDESLNVVMKLRNGSAIRGKLKPVETFILKTRYGTLRVPVKEVRSIMWGKPEKEERDSIRSSTGVFTGWIENEEKFELDTGFGVLRIPPDQVKELRVIRSGMNDSFDDASLDSWKIQGGSWKVHEGKLQCTSNGNYQNQIHWEEELEGSYNLEVTINGTNNVGVVWHANSSMDLYALWIQQGVVYVYGGNPWWNANVLNTQWGYNPPAGGYKVRLEVEGTRATIFINETKLGTVTTQRDKGYAGLWLYNGTAEFDDFKIEP